MAEHFRLAITHIQPGQKGAGSSKKKITGTQTLEENENTNCLAKISSKPDPSNIKVSMVDGDRESMN